MTETINEAQDAIIGNFSLFEDDLESTLFYLMDLGKKLPPMKEEDKIADRLVKGCQSKVWLKSEMQDGHIYFTADSNTEITKGLISLLIRVWNGHTPDEILSGELYFIDRIGMSRMIGTQRSNGFGEMIRRMKTDALVYKTSKQE